MTQVSGSNIVVACYDETVWGADPSPANGHLVYLSSLGLRAAQNRVDDPTITGGRGARRSGRGNIDVSGGLSVAIAPENIGRWLLHLLGAPTTVGTEAPYTHTFVPTTLPAGFTLEKDFTAEIASKVERFNGCRILSATFNCPQEGIQTLDMQIAGRKRTINAAVLDATLGDPGHDAFSGFEGIVKVGGTQTGGIISANFTIANNIDDQLYTFPGTGETAGLRFSLAEGRCMISGTLETVFQDFTLVDLAAAGTETTIQLLWSRGTGLGAAANESLSLLLDHADLELVSPALETEAGLRVSYGFRAFASGSDEGLEVTLKNAVAGADL
jgi:hypothetical protein